MNELVDLSGTGEKQLGCEYLPYDISLRNKANKQANKQIKQFVNLKPFHIRKRVA